MSAKENSINTVIVPTTTSVNGTIGAKNNVDTKSNAKKKLNKKNNRKSVETTENEKNAKPSSTVTSPSTKTSAATANELNRDETIAVCDELVRRLVANGSISHSDTSTSNHIGLANHFDAKQSSEEIHVTSANKQILETISPPSTPSSPSQHVKNHTNNNNNNHKTHDNNTQYKQSKQISKTSCKKNNGIAATVINADGSVTVQCNGSYPSLSTKYVRNNELDQPSTSSTTLAGHCISDSLPKSSQSNGPMSIGHPSVEFKSQANLSDACASSSIMAATAAAAAAAAAAATSASAIASKSSDPNSLIPKTVASIRANDVEISIKEYVNELQMPDLIRVIQKDLSEPYSIYTYRYFIHNWPKLCFLAMDMDKCIGAIVCKLDVHRQTIRRGYIAMLAVDKDYRKLKVGTTLVHKAIEAMLEHHADEVVLETEITNIPALRLYENLGFVRDKRLFDYYLNGVDALRLKLWFK